MMVSSLRKIQVAMAVLFCMCRFDIAQTPLASDEKKPNAVKVLEIGKTTNQVFIAKLKKYPEWNDCSVQIYIINYGTDREIARRERLIISSFSFRYFDCSRRTLVRGGMGKPNTVIWKIPPGADYPTP